MKKLLALTISSITLMSAPMAFAENDIPASLTQDRVLDTVKVGLPDAQIVFTDGETVLFSPSTGLAMKGEAFDYKMDVNLTEKVKQAKLKTPEEKNISAAVTDKAEVDSSTQNESVQAEADVQPKAQQPVIPKVHVDLSGAAEVQRRARNVINTLLPKNSAPLLTPQEPAIPQIQKTNAPSANPKPLASVADKSAAVVAQSLEKDLKPSATTVTANDKSNLSEDEQFKEELINLHENLLKDDATIVFRAPDEKYTITVFTDITCPYCRRFHRDELPKLLDLGVTVRYLPYPRAGLESDTARQMAGIFCSDNQQQLLTVAKKGQSVRRDSIDCSPLFKLGYKLGQILHIPGTPTIFSENGDFWPGLMKAEDIYSTLEAHRAEG